MRGRELGGNAALRRCDGGVRPSEVLRLFLLWLRERDRTLSRAKGAEHDSCVC